MEREEIVRDDFPTVRKGWSPEAVEAHLRAVADWVAATSSRAKTKATPAADAASERVGAVLAAAESTAAEIIEEAETEAERIVVAAEAEADQIRAAARTESEEAVSAASAEASSRVEQAQAAVEGLVAQADRLRNQVGALGRDLAANVPGIGSSGSPRTDVDDLPAMPADPEPDGEPDADAAPEKPAEPEVEPAAERKPDPEPAPEKPQPRRRGRRRPAAKPAPEPTSSAPARSGPTDDELIARLRGGNDEPTVEEPPAPAISGSEQGAARLVAMNMALEGSSREQIAKQLEAEFGSVDDQLLDDVLRRAKR